jgi:hypothetical protein
MSDVTSGKTAFVRGLPSSNIAQRLYDSMRFIDAFNPTLRTKVAALLRRVSFMPPLNFRYILHEAKYFTGGEIPEGEHQRLDFDTLMAKATAGDAYAIQCLASELAEDERVRPALVKLGRDATDLSFRPFARALGNLGGSDAMDLLRAKLQELQGSLPFARDPADSAGIGLSFTIAETAASLLKMDHDAVDASRVLARLLEHPAQEIQVMAVHTVSRLVVRMDEAVTPAAIELRRALSRFADCGSDELFLAAAEGLMTAGGRPGAKNIVPSDILWRCQKSLRAIDANVRQAAIQAIRYTPRPMYGMAMDSLLRILPGLHVQEAIEVAQWLVPFVPPAMLERILKEAFESDTASTRERAIRLLWFLPFPAARAIADEAEENEMEPRLRERLQRFPRMSGG